MAVMAEYNRQTIVGMPLQLGNGKTVVTTTSLWLVDDHDS